MRVLVCGGRGYDDYATVERVLGEIHAATPITVIIEGGATGADQLAFRWAAIGNRCGTETHAANWQDHGRAAGPIRNATMLREGRPDLVVAFPGGRGTADMIKRAKAAGVRVVKVAG
jgi:predicted Rossmann-fold nucleotide-binding protein